jgi:hypothetical protein
MEWMKVHQIEGMTPLWWKALFEETSMMNWFGYGRNPLTERERRTRTGSATVHQMIACWMDYLTVYLTASKEQEDQPTPLGQWLGRLNTQKHTVVASSIVLSRGLRCPNNNSSGTAEFLGQFL